MGEVGPALGGDINASRREGRQAMYAVDIRAYEQVAAIHDRRQQGRLGYKACRYSTHKVQNPQHMLTSVWATAC